MPIRATLPSFWWFEEGRIGGMSRPGFNRVDWDDLALEESVILSWLGKLRTTKPTSSDLRVHMDWYREMVCVFGHIPVHEVDACADVLADPAHVLRVVERVNERTDVLAHAKPAPESDGFELVLSERRTQAEVDALLGHRFEVLVSLEEHGPPAVVSESDLDVHHLPVDDMRPPRIEQVEAFARLLDAAERGQRRLVVHCLAGIGRTTTMLVAGHLLRGHALGDLVRRVREQNPRFHFVGAQWEFIEGLANRTGA